MVTKRVRWTEEFKWRAVQLCADNEKSMKDLAAELGVVSATLSKERRVAGVAVPYPSPEAEDGVRSRSAWNR